MTRPVYMARRRLETNEFKADITVTGTADPDNATIAVPAGDYYMDATAAGESLVQTIDAQLEAAYPASNFTVTFSMATGLVTIAIAAGTMSWAWNTGSYGTAFRDWMGFGSTGDFGPVASQQGGRVAQGLIYCNSGFTNFERHPRHKTVGVAVAENGIVAKVGKSGNRRTAEQAHHFEPVGFVASPLASGAWDDEGAVDPWSWADFMDHCAVHPFRVYADTTTAIGSYRDTYDLDQSTSTIYQPKHKTGNSELHWIVRVGLHKYVVAA